MKVLQTFSGVIADNLWGTCPFFSLEYPIHSSYCGSGFAYMYCILLVKGRAIGIFYNDQKLLVSAEDENGRSCSDGSCILGKSSCPANLCFHLRDVVKSSCYKPFEELQYDLHIFKLSHTCKRKRKRSSANKNTDDHTKTKQLKTLKDTNQQKQVSESGILENLSTATNQKKHFDDQVCNPNAIRNSFHDCIKDGPIYICSSCTQPYLKHSVQIVVGTKSKHKDLMLARLTGYKSVGDKKWVCKTCIGTLASGEKSSMFSCKWFKIS